MPSSVAFFQLRHLRRSHFAYFVVYRHIKIWHSKLNFTCFPSILTGDAKINMLLVSPSVPYTLCNFMTQKNLFFIPCTCAHVNFILSYSGDIRHCFALHIIKSGISWLWIMKFIFQIIFFMSLKGKKVQICWLYRVSFSFRKIVKTYFV